MRLSLCLAALMLIFGSCKQKSSESQKNASNTIPVSIELSVTGMHCMGCVETVRSSIAQLEGIDTVSVSLDSARAWVTYKPGKADSVKIREAVELNGYKIVQTREVGEDD